MKLAANLPKIVRSKDQEEKLCEMLNGKTTNLPFAPNALTVVAKRYLRRTHEDKILENPEEMYERVAHHLAKVEKHYGASDVEIQNYTKEFFEIMSQFKFTPAGRTLANAGAETRLVANCIVLHIEDSMDHIFGTLSDAALLQQAGSGLGFPLHLLRPAGEITKRSFGKASGPVSFLHVYNTSFGVIKQQNRHGANMAIMSVDHPDILEFIQCKDVEGDLKNFNVSVGLTHRFMKAVKENDPKPWTTYFKDKQFPIRKINRDRNFNLTSIENTKMTAKELFMQIVDSAWKTGEPGCVFLDTVNETNPLPGLGRIEACNPCGEQFLHDGDVCNLGSINLEKFVSSDRKIDFDELCRVTKLAVRLLDNVIDVSEFPVERVNKTARNNRRIGLGIMGFADMLYRLRIPYNSTQGRDTARQVMSCIRKSAHEMSCFLGESKGAFKNWDKSIWKEKNVIRRNSALTNIAPTGTIAMMFNVSGGVEPYFALAYHYKNVLGGDVSLQYFNKHLEQALKEAGVFSKEIVDEIEKKGSLQNIEKIPESVRKVFVTSMDISADDHILMQAAMQENCDNAISKTINFPNSATHEDIFRGYLLAWENKCKGCTVYRNGSRFLQVLNLNDDKDKKKEENKTKSEQEQTKDIMNDDKQVIQINSSSSSSSSSSSNSSTKRKKVSSASVSKKLKSTNKKNLCPDCDDGLIWQEGCCLCHSCGYSACSKV